MTTIEIQLTLKHLEENFNTFFTDMEAYKLGYKTDLENIFKVFNINNVIKYCIVHNHPLLSELIARFGKLTQPYEDYPIICHLDMYDDNVILNDISKSNLNNYLNMYFMLPDKCRLKCLTMLSKDNINTLTTNKIDVPPKYVNDDIKLLYTRWRLTQPKALEYLVGLNDAVFVYKNYNMLKHDVVDSYLMMNITYFNDSTVTNLLASNIPLKVIYKYHKDRSFKYILEHIKTIDDLKMILRNLPNNLSIEVYEELYKKFPMFKDVLDHFIIIKIKEP
jgi:hypothetical protein